MLSCIDAWVSLFLFQYATSYLLSEKWSALLDICKELFIPKITKSISYEKKIGYQSKQIFCLIIFNPLLLKAKSAHDQNIIYINTSNSPRICFFSQFHIPRKRYKILGTSMFFYCLICSVILRKRMIIKRKTIINMDTLKCKHGNIKQKYPTGSVNFESKLIAYIQRSHRN